MDQARWLLGQGRQTTLPRHMTMEEYREPMEPARQRREGADTEFFPPTQTEATDQHGHLLKTEADGPKVPPRVTIYV